MMDATDTSEAGPPRRRSKLPLLLGVVLMAALGGGGFYAVYSGLVLGGHADEGEEKAEDPAPLPDVAFIAVEPLIVSLGDHTSGRHLRFAAQVEVEKAHAEEVQSILPRLVDVMNTYLRAMDMSVLDDPTALVRLRAQLLRRLQMVAGDGRVRDVLVTEFVIN